MGAFEAFAIVPFLLYIAVFIYVIILFRRLVEGVERIARDVHDLARGPGLVPPSPPPIA